MKKSTFLLILLFLVGLLFLALESKAQVSVVPYQNPRVTFLCSGAPCSGGFLFTYQAGTLNPQATYKDSTGLPQAQNSNPIILDSTGSAVIYLTQAQSYKFILQNAQAIQQWSQDNINALSLIVSNPAANASQSIAGPISLGIYGITAATANIQCIRNICFADQFSGADLGLQIAAADAQLGSSKGQIWVTSSGTVSTAVTISANHDLICAGSQVTLSMSTTSSAILQSSHTRVKGCNFSSSLTSGVNGEIFSQSTTDVQAEDVTFLGGGAHIQYNNVSKFRIIRPISSSLTAPSNVISIFQSSNGQIIAPRIEGFVYASSGSAFRGIWVSQSSHVEVISPNIRDIDASTISTFAGVDFSQSTNCSLTGGEVTGLKNGDGILTENGSTDIDITGTQSYGNSPSAGSGSGALAGDGFDIFNSARVHISNVNARSNGILITNTHHNIEIFSSYDVTVDGAEASDGGRGGVSVVGSPKTKLLGVNANRNQFAGADFVAVTGTVNTAGTAVTLTAGSSFGLAWPLNTSITINGAAFLISSVTDASHLTLTATAGAQTGVSYSVDSYDGEVIGGEYSGNGIGLGAAGTREGIYAANNSTLFVSGVRATDAKSSQTQTYGLRLENTATATYVGNNFFGNLNGDVLDSVGLSSPLGNAGPFGGKPVAIYSACETLAAPTTLNTGATTTDTGLSCLPANAIIDFVTYRITTTITTAANFTIGDATTAARFCGTQSTLTAGTTGTCFVQADQTGAAGPRQTSAVKVRVTTNVNPGAGAIRLTVWYHSVIAPTF